MCLRDVAYEALPDDEGMRLDLFLNDRMMWRSRNSIQKLISESKVRLEEKVLKKASRRVKSGEVFTVAIPIPKRQVELPIEGFELPVLYQDRWIMVIDKPTGIPVHPGGRILEGTVIDLLNERFGSEAPLKLCHRLDLETSGVLLIARDTVAMPSFAAQFEHREAKKEYLALVHGEMKQEEGEIDLPIGMVKGSLIHMKRGINHESGQPARTGFRVERRLPGFTLVRLRLHTGRHHQIRVHLSATGYPIVGDKIYGLDEKLFIRYHQNSLTDEDRAVLILPRQALHAARLTIRHVTLKKPMTFEAPLPRDIAGFMDTLA